MQQKLKLFLCCSLLAVVLAGCGVLGSKDEPVIFVSKQMLAQRELVYDAERLLRAEDYAAIEERMAKYRRNMDNSANGVSDLVFFSHGLAGVASRQETSWFDMQQQLLVWRKKHPNSKTMQIALAGNFLFGEIAALKNKSYSEAVPEDQAVAEKRAKEAKKILGATKAARFEYPEWYLPALFDLAWQQEDEGDHERFTNEGVKRFPQFHVLYFDRVRYLIHAEKPSQEWYDYASKISDRFPGEAGDRFYARIIWILVCEQTDLPEFLGRLRQLDWPRAKRGFESLLREYEDDRESIYGPYAAAAWVARDQDTLKELFGMKLDKQMDILVWHDVNQFKKARKWALEDKSF